MIQNYAEYEMTEKERVLFLCGGYLAAAGIVFLFYHSFILSALCGFLVIRIKPYYTSWRARQRQRIELEKQPQLVRDCGGQNDRQAFKEFPCQRNQG